MGILNVTPDSFYDGGQYNAVEDAVARAEQMVADGADIVDLGGESTRPGADPVPVEEERGRVVPVLEQLDVEVPVSIDTRKPAVAEAALDAGADIVNDVSGLADEDMRELVARDGCPAIVMDAVNLPVEPSTPSPYNDVVEDVKQRLAERVQAVEDAGVAPGQLVVDPGIGFGKTGAESVELLASIGDIADMGYPVLIGASRKSFMGDVLDLPKEERLEPGLVCHAVAAMRGADIVRTHDVAETARAVRMADALR